MTCITITANVLKGMHANEARLKVFPESSHESITLINEVITKSSLECRNRCVGSSVTNALETQNSGFPFAPLAVNKSQQVCGPYDSEKRCPDECCSQRDCDSLSRVLNGQDLKNP